MRLTVVAVALYLLRTGFVECPAYCGFVRQRGRYTLPLYFANALPRVVLIELLEPFNLHEYVFAKKYSTALMRLTYMYVFRACFFTVRVHSSFAVRTSC